MSESDRVIERERERERARERERRAQMNQAQMKRACVEELKLLCWVLHT